MAGDESRLTPEKQLLKLIEDPNNDILKKRSMRRKGISFLSPEALEARFSLFVNKLKKGFSHDGALVFDLRLINRMLLVALLVLSGYFAFFLTQSILKIGKADEFRPKIRPEHAAALPEVTGLKNLSHYLEKAIARDIFRPASEQIVEKPQEETKPASSQARQATGHLVLVGIAWSANPDAMIEDTKAQKTFFVKKGNRIGDIKVEAVLRDKVILSYEGEEVELK
jgi:type II secretory pathway component PulC